MTPWVPIAWCNNAAPGVWHEIDGAPVSLHRARDMVGLAANTRPIAGVFMAQRRGPLCTELVFKDCRK